MSLPTNDAERKALPLWTFLTEYFPDAFVAVANVAIAGNQQHNPGQPLHWAREKSTDQMNTAFRHMFDYGLKTVKDTDGQYHLAKAIWRLSAELQLLIEKEQKERIPISFTEWVKEVPPPRRCPQCGCTSGARHAFDCGFY
jgi:hypothetical protein